MYVGKYTLGNVSFIETINKISLPQGANIVDCYIQYDNICLSFIVMNGESKYQDRTIHVYCNNEKFVTPYTSRMQHIRSVVANDLDKFVFHIFEVWE